MQHTRCQCCCPTIGFDVGPNAVTGCCTGMSAIINLKSDVSRLGECKAVFCVSCTFSCSAAVQFITPDWDAVRAYVQGGGRLFIWGEHSGNVPPPFPGFFNQCLFDMTNLNNFLTALGSSIRYVGNDYNQSGPFCTPTYYSPGAAKIAQGLAGWPGERFGEVDPGGGKTLWLGNAGTGLAGSGAGKTAAAVEKVGSGFVFLTGDGNFCDTGLDGSFCAFIKRVWEYADADIL